MRLRYALAILFSTLAGCDIIGGTSFDVDGDWASFGPSAQLGECCTIVLTLAEDDGSVEGAGYVLTPGTQIGQSFRYPVDAIGTYDAGARRLDLTVNGSSHSGTLRVEVENPDAIMHPATFTGTFGRADSLSMTHYGGD